VNLFGQPVEAIFALEPFGRLRRSLSSSRPSADAVRRLGYALGVSDAIGQLFQGLINFLTPILIPDWKALIDLLPVFLLIAVVGPLLSLLALGWMIYFMTKPRSRIPYADPEPRPAEIVDGQPVYPVGEPYCALDHLVLPIGMTRCPVCGRDAAVVCPKCGTGRAAYIETCGTCGLVLKIDHTVPALRPAEPPPGGAAAA
jgi:hypothetical protein